MSGVSVKTRVVFNRFGEIGRSYALEAGRIVQETGAQIERDAKSSMRGPKHGRMYRRGAITRKYKIGGAAYQNMKGRRAKYAGNGKAAVTVGYKFHRASAPGEAPAIDFGKLVNSIEMTFRRASMTAIVYATAIYAARLEKDLDRPFMAPAAVKAWPTFLARMKKVLGL